MKLERSSVAGASSYHLTARLSDGFLRDFKVFLTQEECSHSEDPAVEREIKQM